MNEVWTLLLVVLAGFALGMLFFGGLWWTVQKVLSSSRPTLWLLWKPGAANDCCSCWFVCCCP